MTRGRAVAAGAAALLSLAVTGWFTAAASAERAVAVDSARALVGAPRAATVPPAALAGARTALRRAPLNQDAANVLYYGAARGGDAGREGEALARLGWRSTAAQQNLIADAARREDFAEVLERVDSLLRRGKLGPQLDPFLRLVESDRGTRAALVAKLRRTPPWREGFLIRGGELRGRDALAARAAVMSGLIGHGEPLQRMEVSPFLQAAIAGGEVLVAHRLWSRTLKRPGEGGLLYDGRFRAASEQGTRPQLPVPFEWRFETGDGFTTSVGSDGSAFLRWNGRGVPVVLSQLVSVPPGARGFRLVVEGDAPTVPVVADRLQASLTCGGRGVEFRPVRREPTRLTLEAGPLRGCAHPTFALAGRLQDQPEALTASIAGMRLDPVGAPAR